MSEFLHGVPSGEYGIVPPANPELNGHAGNTFSPRILTEALLILGIGVVSAIGAFEGVKALGEALDSIPDAIGYSQPSTQPSTTDIIKFSLRNP